MKEFVALGHTLAYIHISGHRNTNTHTHTRAARGAVGDLID